VLIGLRESRRESQDLPNDEPSRHLGDGHFCHDQSWALGSVGKMFPNRRRSKPLYAERRHGANVAAYCNARELIMRIILALALLTHDPEKCVAVFRKDHAQSKT
jgi:hypothetical protein